MRKFSSALITAGIAVLTVSGSDALAQRKQSNGFETTTSAIVAVADDTRRTRLAAVKTWDYQLRQIAPAEIAASGDRGAAVAPHASRIGRWQPAGETAGVADVAAWQQLNARPVNAVDK